MMTMLSRDSKHSARAVASVVLGALAMVVVSGCEPFTDPITKPIDRRAFNDPDAPIADTDIVATSYAAAERLMNNMQGPLDPQQPILVANLVDVDDLERTSTLGRLLSEQIASRLSQLGYQMIEMKLRDTFLVQDRNGEFILSRDIRQISQARNAQAIIAGTYAVARDQVFVNLKVIRPGDSKVMAATDLTLPMGPNTAALVLDLAPVAERSPF